MKKAEDKYVEVLNSESTTEDHLVHDLIHDLTTDYTKIPVLMDFDVLKSIINSMGGASLNKIVHGIKRRLDDVNTTEELLGLLAEELAFHNTVHTVQTRTFEQDEFAMTALSDEEEEFKNSVSEGQYAEFIASDLDLDAWKRRYYSNGLTDNTVVGKIDL